MKKVKCDIKLEVTLSEEDIDFFTKLIEGGTSSSDVLAQISHAVRQDIEKCFPYNDVTITKIKSRFTKE